MSERKQVALIKIITIPKFNHFSVNDIDLNEEMTDDGKAIPPTEVEQPTTSLPALFPTPSLTDISSINRTGSFQFQFQTDSNQHVQARETINQIIELHDLQHKQINKIQVLQKQIVSSGNTNSEELINQQYMLNQQINDELKHLREINRNTVLDPEELHNSRIIGQRLQIQQQGLDLLCRELAQVGMQSNTDP